MANEEPLAGIEYTGKPGISEDCLDAVKQLVQCHYDFGRVLILTHRHGENGTHCLLINNSIGDQLAVKSGFSSGYHGGGPSCFSEALMILKAHQVTIDECLVEQALIDRLDDSALTGTDIDAIEKTRPVRPTRWHDYILDKEYRFGNRGNVWDRFDPVIPFAIIDKRLFDLASTFWDNPDEKLLSGYRRLEDIIRKRTELAESGSRLFSRAFNKPDAALEWRDIENGEASGRVNLFVGAYSAHRNPRAHRELPTDPREQLSEFLLLNHLYRFESEATLCESTAEGDSSH